MDNCIESNDPKNSTYLHLKTSSIQSSPQTLDSIVQGRTASDFRIRAYRLYGNKRGDGSLPTMMSPRAVHVQSTIYPHQNS